MAGVYGNMLLHFGEQRSEVTYFFMPPLHNNGYGPREDVTTIRAILQNSWSKTKDNNGNIVRMKEEHMFYEGKLEDGWFIEYQGIVYRLTGDSDWPRTGGFYHYLLSKLVGTPGETTEPEWKTI